MSAPVTWTLVGLALGAVLVRRRSAAITLVALQSLLLGVGAVLAAPGRGSDEFLAALLLAARGLALAALLRWVMERSRERRPVPPAMAPVARLGVASGLALLVVLLVPPLPMGGPATQDGALAMVVTGVAMVLTRRATLFHVLGLVMAENGLAVAALGVSGGLPLVIEMGAIFDLVVIVAVAALFHQRIFREFGTADTALLADLRD